MKVYIVGSTGKTGKELVKQALGQGHLVTALARTPKKLNISHPKLTIINGDILDPNSFQDSLKEHDAVISALGHKRFFIKTRILSQGTHNLMMAMQKHHIKRFICVTSLGINDTRFKLGLYYTLFVEPVILFFYFRDKEKQEQLIAKSNLDWTIVRPGQLTNGSKRKTYKHGLKLGSYILTKMISRADVAHFLLSELKENNYIKKTPAIIY